MIYIYGVCEHFSTDVVFGSACSLPVQTLHPAKMGQYNINPVLNRWCGLSLSLL